MAPSCAPVAAKNSSPKLLVDLTHCAGWKEFLDVWREAGMRTLIYKRTHSNDPDPRTGVFGNRDCMGQVRAWDFDAVIGIGGVGDEPRRHRIAGKLTWIGIGPQRLYDDPDRRGPQVTFRHFLYLGENGPLLAKK